MSSHLYTDWDAGACAWTRELISAGLIPDGHVLEKCITTVTPNDLELFDNVHAFAGIAGWPLAMQLCGWPDDLPLWTASLPCQPFSVAGRNKGTEDERHLWPVFRDLVDECRPPVIAGEQVASAAGREWLAGVRADLEALGYAVAAADLCAASVGAPHIRQRLFWVAHSRSQSAWRRLRRSAQGFSEAQKRAPDQSGGSGGADRVSDTCSRGRHSSIGGPGGEDPSERSETIHQSLRRGPADGLSDTCGQRIRAERRREDACTTGEMPPGEQQRQRIRTDVRTTGGLGNTDSGLDDSAIARCSRNGIGSAPSATRNEARLLESAGSNPLNPWAGWRPILCLDGKWRRIPEAETEFPLQSGVDGLPSRVGLLRGAGNAIVPQVAAKFLTAFLQSILT